MLEQRGYNATVRLTRGRDIDAACGQLAAKALAGLSRAVERRDGLEGRLDGATLERSSTRRVIGAVDWTPRRARSLDRRRSLHPRAHVAGLEQALAQLVLLAGRGVPARGVGQVADRGEAEELQEQRRRAVEDGAELRAAGFLDQPALEQRRRPPSRR